MPDKHLPHILAAVPDTRPIVTLLSDFGTRDYYVAAMKAVLVRDCPDVRLIDVTHDVPRHDIVIGSITLERAVASFPLNTIHLAVVDPGVGTDRRILVVKLHESVIVCPDNGLITWAWRRMGPGQAHELIWRTEQSSSTFHGRDIMAPAAAMLACGRVIAEIGREIDDPILLDLAPSDSRSARVIHIDVFGNATTNMDQQRAVELSRLQFRVHGHSLGPLRRTYSDVAPGVPLALIGSSGLLEIAVRNGSAAQQLGLRVGEIVSVESMAKSRISNFKSEVPTAGLRRFDKQLIWDPFTPMQLWVESDPLVIVAGEGMYLVDSDGKRYLDGVSSLWCNVHGHRVQEIDSAIRNQLDKIAHSTMLGLASEPAILLADTLIKIVPPRLAKVFYSDSGATATEIAFKLAAQYWYNIGKPQKNEFIGFAEAYHGDTVGAMSIGRMPAFHKPYFPMLFKVHFAPSPYVFRHPRSSEPQTVARECLAELEAVLRQHAERIAAVCIEPIVQGAGGMIVQPEGFLHGVRELASEYDVLLIADEVATGFGRTGRMFACEHENISPDLLCAAKGITGGYLPLAATLATQKIFDAFLDDPLEGKTFYHGHTYTGNPLACAAALASLELFDKNNLLRSVQEKSQAVSRMLEDLRLLKHVGDIRQKGFMVGIELVEDKRTKRPFDPKRRVGAEVCMKVRSHGVILRPLGDVVVMMPPLAMGLDDLKTIVEAVTFEVNALS